MGKDTDSKRESTIDMRFQGKNNNYKIVLRDNKRYTLSNVQVAEKEDLKQGETYFKDIGYFSTFYSAIRRIFDLEMRESKAETLKDFYSDYQQFF